VSVAVTLFLRLDAWLRLAAWLGIGLALYFVYGARHGKLRTIWKKRKDDDDATGFLNRHAYGVVEIGVQAGPWRSPTDGITCHDAEPRTD
jgi:hypothetical protein